MIHFWFYSDFNFLLFINSCEIASSESLLEDLFPDDTGLYSPNPANRYLLQKVDTKEIADFVSATGRPFLWAQRLAGVEFPPLTVRNFSNGFDFDKNY